MKTRVSQAILGVLAVAAFLMVTRLFAGSFDTSGDAAACRSLLAYEVTAAKAELDVLFARGLRAAVTNDDATAAALADQVPERSKALEEALAEQEAGVQLSLSDPDAFLRRCEERY